ncbi:MAG TPA: KTSC domain-containing protein [Candidatus Paceibacterota bacterium]|nr:KTSC domain-containing protein [Candidatus Paceibacterota bacterium]
MNRISVVSSNINSIGYDEVTSTLEVEFTSGDIYHYLNIPKYLFQQFLHSSSHGQFLNDFIRYNYKYQKIN